MKKRRIAVHELRYDDETIVQAFVELVDGKVLKYGHLKEELPMTEWLGGTIVLSAGKDGCLRAFWNGKLL